MQIKFCHNLQGVGDFVVRVNPSNKLEKFLLLVFQYHGPHIGNSFFTMNCIFYPTLWTMLNSTFPLQGLSLRIQIIFTQTHPLLKLPHKFYFLYLFCMIVIHLVHSFSFLKM
jgi:hypothetical protein